MIYYLKFHFELNYLKYFWYNGQNWTKKNYKYSIKGLREDIPKTLTQLRRLQFLNIIKVIS